MFVFTLGKNALRRAGLAALCLACMAGAAAVVSQLNGGSVTVSAGQETQIAGAEDVGAFFTGYGMEVDLTTAAVDQVKIPRKWDESFEAFHAVVTESGLSLDRYKGKKVQKWTVLCPGRSDGQNSVYGVVLVYKKKPVGAYLLTQPGGEVTGLTTAQQTAAALTEAEAAAGQDFGEQAQPAQGDPAESAAQEAAAEVTVGDAEAEAAEANAAAAEEGAWPTE